MSESTLGERGEEVYYLCSLIGYVPVLVSDQALPRQSILNPITNMESIAIYISRTDPLILLCRVVYYLTSIVTNVSRPL